MSVGEMVADGQLEIVEADAEGARSALDEARQHVGSARLIAGSDANGAYQLAYDAARKAAMSSMRAAGLRVRQGEGAHMIAAAYTAAAIDEGLGKRLDSARRRRNRSEYGSAFFDDDSIADAIALADALIAAVAAASG
ncbi:MAG: hypothetical protein ACRDL2_05600 [Gaiellaceae bacterium]